MADEQADNRSPGLRDDPREDLRSLVRFVRRRWAIVVGLALLGAVVGALVAHAGDRHYEASASILFSNDPVNRLGGLSDDYLAVGDPTIPGAPTATRERLIKERSVALAVKRELGSDRSVGSLTDSIRAEGDVAASLVRVIAESDDPQAAARLANVWARTFVRQENRRSDRRLDRAIAVLRPEAAAKSTPSGRRRVVRDLLSRLEGLKSVGLEPSEIVDTARPPTEPVGAGWPVGAAAGLLIGLVIGFAVAMVADWRGSARRSPAPPASRPEVASPAAER